MTKFLLWLILLVICWPLALLALILYPIIWILLLAFRLIGITVGAVFDLFKALITLPARLLRGPGRPRRPAPRLLIIPMAVVGGFSPGGGGGGGGGGGTAGLAESK